MALIYKCESQVVEMSMRKLKADGLVSENAYFNCDAPRNLRKEVAYRDFDFLSRLSRIAGVEIVSSVLAWLKQRGIVSDEAGYDEKSFDELREEVRGGKSDETGGIEELKVFPEFFIHTVIFCV